MRICVISSYPPSLNGVANYCAKLCKAMLGVDNNLHLLVLSDAQSNTQVSEQLKIVKGWDRCSLLYPLKVFKTLWKWKPHAAHCQHEYWLYGRHIYSITFLGLLSILKILSLPIVVTLHCVIPRRELEEEFFYKHHLGKKFTFIKKLYVFLYTKLIGLASSKVIIHSEIARDVLFNDYGFDIKKTFIVFHGVENLGENQQSTQHEAKKRLAFLGKHVLLLFGQIRHGKGIEYAIRAMPNVLAKHPSSSLVVAGIYNPELSPESAGYLEELIALSGSLDLKSNVVFRTNIPEDEISTYLTAADIFIASYIEDEIIAASGPISMAIAYGKPLIASEIKRFTDVLNGKNCIFVPPADSDRLAEAIIMLLENSELMKKLSQEAKLSVSGRSWEQVASKTLELYDELISGRIGIGKQL